MSSGDRRMNFYVKKWFHLGQVRDNFLGYLKNMIEATRRRQFPYSGLFDEVVLSSNAVDTFDVQTPCEGMDDGGHETSLPVTELGTTEIYDDVSFPNESAVVYSVGMRWNGEMPGSDLDADPPQTAIETNVRTGEPEYALREEVAGEVEHPDDVSLAITPTALRLIVDSALLCGEPGVDPINHSGRRVRVWLDNPVSHVDAVGIYDGVVAWGDVGGTDHNYVDIPYTTEQGPLGQTTPDYPISMIEADYWVWVKGVTVTPKSVKDLSTDGDYIFLGEVTGVGRGSMPTVFDITGQTYLSRASGLSTGPIPGTPHSIGTSNAQQVLEDILGWLNAHLRGDADQHPATHITTQEIIGTPFGIPATHVQGALTSLLGLINGLFSGGGSDTLRLSAIDGDPHKLGYDGTIPEGGWLTTYLTNLLGWVNDNYNNLADFISALSDTTPGSDGALLVGAQARTGSLYQLATTTVAGQLGEILAYLNGTQKRCQASHFYPQNCYDGTGANYTALAFDTEDLDNDDMIEVYPWKTVDSVQTTPTNTITLTDHGYSDGDAVYFRGSDLPVPLIAGSSGFVYFVRDATTHTFKLAPYLTGAAIPLIDAGSGTIEVRKVTKLVDIKTAGRYLVIASLTFGGDATADTWRVISLERVGTGGPAVLKTIRVPGVVNAGIGTSIQVVWEGQLVVGQSLICYVAQSSGDSLLLQSQSITARRVTT